MHSNRGRLIKNFLSLVSLRGLEFLIPLITIPYLLRTIGIDKYGMIGFGYAFAAYFGAIVQYGFNVTATRDIARNRTDILLVNKIFSTTFITSAILAITVIITAGMILITVPILRNDWQLLLLSLGQALAQSLFPIWLFQGMERMSFITYLNIGSKIAFIIGLVIIVHVPEDYLYVPLLSLLSATIMLIVSLWVGISIFKVEFQLPKLLEVRQTLIAGRHAFVNQFAPNLYNTTTTFMLGLVSSGHTVGLYSAATKIVDAASSIGYILSNTFLPYLSRTIENHKVFKRIMLVTGLLCTITLMASAEVIGRILHPVNGSEIAELVRYASPSVMMIFITLTFGTNYLMLCKRERLYGRITLYTSSAFFLLALVLVPLQGAIGGLAILVGARTCMAATIYFYYAKLK